MPQIIVRADARDQAVMFTERVNVRDFESRHFQAQLVERLGWAVEDAQAVEHDGPALAEARPGEPGPEVLNDAPAVAERSPVSAAQPAS